MSTPATHWNAYLIFGPPGCGKGTLCQFLKVADSLYHLSTGDIFRSLDAHSPQGKLFHSYADKGLLVPDEVTLGIWEDYVKALIRKDFYKPEKQFLLLDGIPRTLHQAQSLDRYVQVKGVIVLEMPDIQALVARLQNRAKLEGRKDDIDEKVIRERMRVYQEQTLAILEHYPSSIVHRFNSQQTKLEVLRDVLAVLASELSMHPARAVL